MIMLILSIFGSVIAIVFGFQLIAALCIFVFEVVPSWFARESPPTAPRVQIRAAPLSAVAARRLKLGVACWLALTVRMTLSLRTAGPTPLLTCTR